MKIKLNNRQIFLAEEVPWFMAIALTFFIFCFVTPGVFLVFDGVWQGAIFALGGGGLGFAGMCVFVERLQVILDTRSGLITLRRRTILKNDETQLPLQQLQRAVVESTISTKDGRTRRLYRPSLVLLEDGAETVRPVTHVYSSGSRAEHLVEAINGWIKTAAVTGTRP